MLDMLESLGKRLKTEREERKMADRLSRSYECRCGTAIVLSNNECPTCNSVLGFLPDTASLVALDPDPVSGTVRIEGREFLYKYCGNRETPARCNWLLEADSSSSFCVACRLNRTIPNLDDADNARYWAAIEAAKRRLVAQLLALGLPVRSKVDEDPERGLMFDFLRSPPNGPRVMTGHASGLITLNVEEADDAKREKIRHDLREPYRTLLGHFRHEVGHYYWDRLVLRHHMAGAVPRAVRRRTRRATPRRSSATTNRARRPTGPIRTSAPTPRCTPGKTGPRPGPTTCTWSTAWTPRSASAWMAKTSSRDRAVHARRPLCARTTRMPSASCRC